MSLLLLFSGRNIPGAYVPPAFTAAPRGRTYYVPLLARAYARGEHDRVYMVPSRRQKVTMARQDRVYVVPRRRQTKEQT